MTKAVIALSIAAAALAGTTAHAATESVLYSFQGGADGYGLSAGLINVGGTLYGVTTKGGANGFGTVFSLTTAGVHTVLYSFKGGSDGATPQGSLISIGKNLYGTTQLGGKKKKVGGCGIVFKLPRAGASTDKVLHAFNCGTDGSEPFASLTNVAGTLYGTTGDAGANGLGGTVFSITTAGAETTLHSFGGTGDGVGPYLGNLFNLGGTLYGTTNQGGAVGSTGCSTTCGTVFSITPTGSEALVYTFTGGNNGAGPESGLVSVGGTLYGTTPFYGTNNDGVVYSVTPAGTEAVLHTFLGGADAAFPLASLINVGGTLYGTSEAGGSSNNGTVFSITPGGVETVVYSFLGGTDGAEPQASLLNVGGTLYGTTLTGGVSTGCSGCGTVFAVTP